MLHIHATEQQAVSISLVMWHQVIVVEKSYPENCGVDAHAHEQDTHKAHHLLERKRKYVWRLGLNWREQNNQHVYVHSRFLLVLNKIIMWESKCLKGKLLFLSPIFWQKEKKTLNKSKYYVTPCSNVILTGLTLTALIHTHLNAMIVVPFFSQLNKDRKQRKDRVCAEEGALRPDYCSGE